VLQLLLVRLMLLLAAGLHVLTRRLLVLLPFHPLGRCWLAPYNPHPSAHS
jgi:hypothetical protein